MQHSSTPWTQVLERPFSIWCSLWKLFLLSYFQEEYGRKTNTHSIPTRSRHLFTPNTFTHHAWGDCTDMTPSETEQVHSFFSFNVWGSDLPLAASLTSARVRLSRSTLVLADFLRFYTQFYTTYITVPLKYRFRGGYWHSYLHWQPACTSSPALNQMCFAGNNKEQGQ